MDPRPRIRGLETTGLCETWLLVEVELSDRYRRWRHTSDPDSGPRRHSVIAEINRRKMTLSDADAEQAADSAEVINV